VTANSQNIKQRLLSECAVFLGLLFVGLVLLPIAIYLVGGEVFGEYGKQGFGGFYRALSGRVRDGDLVAIFLVLSPYLCWSILRLTVGGWRLVGRPFNGQQTARRDLADL